MTQETIDTLNTQTLIGFTAKRGTAWHYRAELQGDEPNHYTGAVPVEDITRRLFNWKAVEGQITATALTDDGVLSYTDPKRKGIMRSDTGELLGIFMGGYQIHDYNEWLIDQVSQLLDADLQVGSAGLIRNGGVGWVQIEMEDTMVSCGVEYRPFLTAATSLDGSLSTTYSTGAQVAVCDNTLSLALSSASEKLKIRHSANSRLRLGEAREALNIVHQAGDIFDQQVQELTAQYVSDSKWKDFLRAYTQPTSTTGRSATMAENKASALNDLWYTDDRVSPWKNTAYGVVAAVNTYTHHVANVRSVSRVERNASNAILGKIDELDSKTLRVLAKV